MATQAPTDHWVSPDVYQPHNPDEPKRKPLPTPGMALPMHRALDQLARAEVTMSGAHGRKNVHPLYIHVLLPPPSAPLKCVMYLHNYVFSDVP